MVGFAALTATLPEFESMYPAARHIESYNHHGRVAAMVEFGLSDDFATRTDEFRDFAHAIAMHVVAMAPESVEALLAQSDLRMPERSVADRLSDLEAVLKSPVAIVRFVRWDAESPLEREREPPEPPRTPANVIRFGTNDR